ncbi:hypothetical protein NDU88_009422 [Pleurodeles waltl]|uniref:Transposase n=1 Tax=Pleurodeles waltl TaxID=8319 RepID=A0AAV7PV57_PLEWA|nr:hypothetical protein NDU88_009422 [Pleurodeles waltl]
MARRLHGDKGLPLIEQYITAFHLLQLAYMLPELPDPPQWDSPERLKLSGHSGLDSLYKVTPPHPPRPNPKLQAMHKTWLRAYRLLITHPYLHLRTAYIDGKNLNWTQWRTAGIHSLDQILADGNLKPFRSLQKE